MITGITVKNGKLRIILVGEDEIDKAALKAMDGATVKAIKDNYRVGEMSIADGVVIEIDPPKKA